jgi:hypothetical protein
MCGPERKEGRKEQRKNQSIKQGEINIYAKM